MLPLFVGKIMSINDSVERLARFDIVAEHIDFDGMYVQEIIEQLQAYVDAHPDEKMFASNSDSYSCSELDIIIHRLETDEEYNARQECVKKEKKHKETQKTMNALLKKQNLSTEEKNKLIKYIKESK